MQKLKNILCFLGLHFGATKYKPNAKYNEYQHCHNCGMDLRTKEEIKTKEAFIKLCEER